MLNLENRHLVAVVKEEAIGGRLLRGLHGLAGPPHAQRGGGEHACLDVIPAPCALPGGPDRPPHGLESGAPGASPPLLRGRPGRSPLLLRALVLRRSERPPDGGRGDGVRAGLPQRGDPGQCGGHPVPPREERAPRPAPVRQLRAPGAGRDRRTIGTGQPVERARRTASSSPPRRPPCSGHERRPFEILPSIDLRGGRVVDLLQGTTPGRRSTRTQEGWRPPSCGTGRAGSTAWTWTAPGTGPRPTGTWCGASPPSPPAPGYACSWGAGSAPWRRAGALAAGASRVVLGTAVERPALVGELVSALGAEAVVVALDGRGGVVATRGWTAPPGGARSIWRESWSPRARCASSARTSPGTAPHRAQLRGAGGPGRGRPCGRDRLRGVTTAAQVARLAAIPLEGAIIGSALYAGRITLPEALAAATAPAA